MSENSDPSSTIERLERRLAREKSARLQAEAIAERVTSDRWELRQQLEDKLALRTSELEAARQAASEAVTVRRRGRSSRTHTLRTSLTALFYLAESLSESEPLSAQQIHEMKRLLSEMQTVLDSQTEDSAAVNPDAYPATTSGGPRARVALSDIISAQEGAWHQIAARAGKLLMLDIDIPPGHMLDGTADDVNRLVLGVIGDRVNTSEPVIELRLTVGPDGLESS